MATKLIATSGQNCDIKTSNAHNFINKDTSKGFDITFLESQSVNILALKNILDKNKESLLQQGLTYSIVNTLVLNKAMELGLKPTNIMLDVEAYKLGILKINYKITGGDSV